MRSPDKSSKRLQVRNAGVSRRQALQYSVTGSLLALLQPVLASPVHAGSLRTIRMPDDTARPAFAAGDVLVVDISRTGFGGNGVYLYPAWGSPRPYQVIRIEKPAGHALLEFRNPGTARLLWVQSLAPAFAGMLVAAPASQAELAIAGIPALRVSALPLA